jgi:hypothetical protein
MHEKALRRKALDVRGSAGEIREASPRLGGLARNYQITE